MLDTDTLFMQRAIDESTHARIISPPNPWVGCVIVRAGQIVGLGFTQSPGSDHAEIQALKAAGTEAKGATVYVTLEPCSHTEKRTAPCTKALIDAGVARVVIALQDPDPHVNGNGIQVLRHAGVVVDVGVCAEAVSQSLKAYIHHRKTGMPFCIVKTATSIDGRIAASDGSSQWITSIEARHDAHVLRAESQAIVIGSGTALIDRPRLTVREVNSLRPPLKVVLDTKGKVSADMPLFESKNTVVLTTDLCPVKQIDAWEKTGAMVHILPLSSDKKIDLVAAMSFLGKIGVVQALVEGGGTLIGSLWKHNLVNQWTTYIGPCLLGDSGTPVMRGVNIPNIHSAPRFKLIGVKQINDCIRLDYSI